MDKKEKVTFKRVGGSCGDEVDVIVTSSARIKFSELCSYVQDTLEYSTIECKQKYLGKLFIKDNPS